MVTVDKRKRKQHRQNKIVDPNRRTVDPINEVVEQYVNKQFLEGFKNSDGEGRWRMLMKVFDDAWSHLETHGGKSAGFPGALSARIRRSLGPLAPQTVEGSPVLPVPIGFVCFYKAQLCLVGIHTQPGMGIASTNGRATAVVVNGGYDDDVDRGSCFIYVGEGGEGTGESQALNRGNAALLQAYQQGSPVRVVRGYKAKSRYAPKWGFRYDGLYNIITVYNDIGQQDRRVWKFVFQSVDSYFCPPLCGCSSDKVVNHLSADSTDEVILNGYTSNCDMNVQEIRHLREQVVEHNKMHFKTQSEKFREPRREISVISPNTHFKMRVSQLVMIKNSNARVGKRISSHPQETSAKQLDNGFHVDSSFHSTVQNEEEECASLGVRQGSLPPYKVPTFRLLLKGLRTCADGDWLGNILPLCKRSRRDDGSPKPVWAQFNFLPYQLKLTRMVSGSRHTITLPINCELGEEYALQYFPQSVKQATEVRILLVPPFETEGLNPWLDVCQGKEDMFIPCENNIDGNLPPTDFTYIRHSIAFLDSGGDVGDTCSGCIPTDVDYSDWVRIPGKGNTCPGVRDPSTERVYCVGRNVDETKVVYGDCSNRHCPCQASYCTNRRWRDGVQFKLSLRRLPDVGWGVFTLEEIPADTFIMEYAGDIIPLAELKARGLKYDKRKKHNYCFAIYEGDDTVTSDHQMPCLDSLYFGNLSRFINHSCDANCAPHPHHHSGNGGRGLSLFSMRQIGVGEELSYDYGTDYTAGMQCKCGSEKCRRYITGHSSEPTQSSDSPEVQSPGSTGGKKRRRE